MPLLAYLVASLLLSCADCYLATQNSVLVADYDSVGGSYFEAISCGESEAYSYPITTMIDSGHVASEFFSSLEIDAVSFVYRGTTTYFALSSNGATKASTIFVESSVGGIAVSYFKCPTGGTATILATSVTTPCP